MKTSTLGRSGLEVSRIAYGSGPLGGAHGNLDIESGIQAVRRARELGINLFDTGRAYGSAEELLGRALRDHLRTDRGEILIATKGGVRFFEPFGSGFARDSSAGHLRSDLETSLATLGVDYIDLYQVHWPDPAVPFAETVGVLQELVAAGKIRHFGVSNFSAEQLAAFDEHAPAETLQPAYHLFYRGEEGDSLRYAREHDVGVLVYGALAHGLLKGGAPFDPSSDFGEIDWRRNHGLFQPGVLEQNLRVAAELRAFAAGHGCTLPQLALAWVLAQPGIHTAILGTGKPRHIEEAALAVDVTLAPSDLDEIERIMQGAAAVPFFNLEDVG